MIDSLKGCIENIDDDVFENYYNHVLHNYLDDCKKIEVKYGLLS